MSFFEKISVSEWQILSEIKNNPQCKIFLYGAGYYAKHYCKNLQSMGIGLSGCLIDNSIPLPPPPEKLDVPIYHLSELNNQTDVLLIIAFYKYKLNKLEPYRSHINKILIADFSCVSLFHYDLAYLKEHETELECVYNFLADHLSRELMIAYVNQRISGNINFCQGLTVSERYFSKLPLRANEYYVDCGAYIGDTIEIFIQTLKKRGISGWHKIVAFEPDKHNFTKLQEYCVHLNDCEVRQQGVYSKNIRKSYSDGCGKSSSLDHDSVNSEIDLIKLDDALLNEPITLIKMDIQGAEFDALQGAQKLIEKNRPRLAICIAHKPQDLFAIPLLLRKMNVQYNFYFSMQQSLYSDITLLAIPKEDCQQYKEQST